MIVAVDLTTAPPGEITAAALEVIAALGRGGSVASGRVLLGREEHRQALRHATHGLATVLTLEGAEPGRSGRDAHRRQKLDLLAAHGVGLVHVAGGGPPDVLSLTVPVVLSVGPLEHRTHPERFTPADRWHRETWWTASAHRADAVLAADAATAEHLQQQLGVDPAKVFVGRDGLAAAYAHAARAQPTRKAA